MVKPTNMTFEQLHEEYIMLCKVMSLSEYTIDFYEVNYRMFNKFIDLSELKIIDMDKRLADEYILHLKGIGMDITLIPTPEVFMQLLSMAWS